MIRKMILAAALFAAAPALAQTAAPAPAPKPVAPMTAPVKMTPDVARLDINTATVEQLAGVKGLGKTFAEAIVKGRPFKTMDDLVTNKILPGDVYAMVKELLTVGQK